MNYGPLVFLVAFFALAGSWFGLVLAPQLQVGRLGQTNTLVLEETYPLARSGVARQGLEVYRACGCAYCHSQQPTQTGVVWDVVLTSAGTNESALIEAIVGLRPGLSQLDAKKLLTSLPQPVLQNVTKEEAEAAVSALKVGNAKSEPWIVPVGPDIARGWAKRRAVAEDFLFDSPVMLGSQRIGPDLANVGLRLPDANWHLRHLYSPRLEVADSTMPPYRFLFDKRKIERAPSPEALALSGGLAPEPGFEIVPKAEARALVAYLHSLGAADAPLYVAPRSVAPPPPPTPTNAPPGTSATNAVAPSAPGK